MRQLTFVEAGRVEGQKARRPPCSTARLFPGPFPVGHETVAEMMAVGDEVWVRKPGDRVHAPFQVSCGGWGVSGRTLRRLHDIEIVTSMLPRVARE